MSGEYFESAEISDVGRKRKNNEDASVRIIQHGIFCVADGMGGQAGGDLASETIITSLQESFAKAAAVDDGTLSKRCTLFLSATNRASKWIKNFADEKVIGQMGSTVVALVIDPRDPRRAVSLHAGDSRLYRYRSGSLNQITADHSAVNALAAKLGIGRENVPAKYQNELLRAVGLNESVELERTFIDISSGDIFLICTDGLTKMLSDDAIAAIIKAGSPSGLQAVAQSLINAANEAGGRDNVTVVLVKALDLSHVPNSADSDPDAGDDDKTLLAAELPMSLSPLTRGSTPDIHGDTPQTPTPITKDRTDETETVAKFLVEEETAAPAVPPSSASMPKQAPAPTSTAGKKVPAEVSKQNGSNGGLLMRILFMVLTGLIGTIVWFAVESESRPRPSATAVAVKTILSKTTGNVATPQRSPSVPGSPQVSAEVTTPRSAVTKPEQAKIQEAYDEVTKTAEAAANEQEMLAFKKAGGSQVVATGRRDRTNAVSTTGENPFRFPNQVAISPADQLEVQRRLQSANTVFEEMLIWFNIKQTADPYIQTAQARRQVPIGGALDYEEWQQCQAICTQLEAVFAIYGVLDQNNRARLLDELRESIKHHD